ncbi:lymphotoxin-alpha-like, partial [Nannospalax galili]
DSGIQNALHWKADRDHAFLQGFSLNNNSLLIPTSGLYFVYSQVVFSGSSCFSEACSLLYLTHEVQLLSSTYPQPMPLLSAHRSVHPGIRERWMCSMYQGAVFLLNKGDQLFTHTDGIFHLYIRSSNVFFGAFAL